MIILITFTFYFALANSAPSTETLDVKITNKTIKLIEDVLRNEIYTNLVTTYLGLTLDSLQPRANKLES